MSREAGRDICEGRKITSQMRAQEGDQQLTFQVSLSHRSHVQ